MTDVAKTIDDMIKKREDCIADYEKTKNGMTQEDKERFWKAIDRINKCIHALEPMRWGLGNYGPPKPKLFNKKNIWLYLKDLLFSKHK